MKVMNHLLVWLLVLQLSGIAPLVAQPVLIEPGDPFQRTPLGAPVGMGVENLRVSQQSPDGTEALLTMDYTYDGFAGPTAQLLPVIGKKGQRGVSGWFGSDPVAIGRGRGTISIKVKYFNDEAGVPPMFTSDQVQVLILNQSGTTRLFAVPFLKNIRWGNASARPALPAQIPTVTVVNSNQAKQIAEEKRQAEAKARAEILAREQARLRAEAEAKARQEAEKLAQAEVLKREQDHLKAEAEARRLAEESMRAEEKRIAEQRTREQDRQRAEAEEKRLAEEKRVAEEKARDEALAREEARKKADAETKRLAEAKAREDARLKAEAEAKRLAEERRIAEAKAKAEAIAREEARKKAEEESRRLAEERRIAEEKAKAEALAQGEARKKAEAEAKRLAEHKRRAEEKALAEATARKDAEEKAKQETLAKASAEAEAKKLAEEKNQAEAIALAASTAPGGSAPVPSMDLARGMKTKIIYVDVVSRSIDRAQMTFGVEFEYQDRLSDPLVGVEVFRHSQPEVSRYFVSQPSEISKSRRNFALFPVKFQPPAGLPDSAGFTTDKVIVYLQEKKSGKRYNIFPATMLLLWRATGSPFTPGPTSGNTIEIDDFRQNDASNGYVSIKYHLVNGSGRLRAKIYEAKKPESAQYFTSELRDIKSGPGLQLIEVRVDQSSKSPNEVVHADTIEVELLDLQGAVLAKVSKQASMVWAKPK